MLYKTHLIFSFLIALISINYFNPSNKLVFLLFLVLSSFVPDIDIQTSKIGRKFKITSFFINKLFSHRGFFHSLLLPALIYFILVYLFGIQEIGLAVSLGICSHIFLDMLTKEGISLFSPFINKRINGFITTGGLIESILFNIILFISIFFVYFKFF